MFNFLCKTLHFRGGNHAFIRASLSLTCNIQHLQSSTLVKHVSTTSSPDSFTVSYLMNSCGLSPDAALAASKYVKFEPQNKNPDLVLEFFKRHGFSQPQIAKIIRGHPRVLWSKPEDTFLPKLEFFYSKGVSKPELAKILCVCPALLHRSLENHIVPSFSFITDMFKSSETAAAVIKRSPYLLIHDIETRVEPNVNVLRENGVPESNIHMFLRHWPRLIGTSSDIFRKNVDIVKEMGFNVDIVVVKGFGSTKWDSKVSVYKRWGWSEEEVLGAFVKYPMFMTVSEGKIMAVMDFLVNKMYLESSAIAKRPHVIVLSLEKTFLPRAAVIQFLMSNGLIEKKNTYLFTVFKYSEKKFLQRFVNSFNEAPQLLKLYEEKLELSKMQKN